MPYRPGRHRSIGMLSGRRPPAGHVGSITQQSRATWENARLVRPVRSATATTRPCWPVSRTLYRLTDVHDCLRTLGALQLFFIERFLDLAHFIRVHVGGGFRRAGKTQRLAGSPKHYPGFF